MSLAPRFFGVMLNETLVAVPLFIFMGWCWSAPASPRACWSPWASSSGGCAGGLGFSVVIVGAVLAASTGVVGATVVTMSLISLPAMLRAGYDRRLACGTICAAATLAQIIPPSTVLIFVADILQGANQQAQLAPATSRRGRSRSATSSPARSCRACSGQALPAAGWPGWPGGTRSAHRLCR